MAFVIHLLSCSSNTVFIWYCPLSKDGRIHLFFLPLLALHLSTLLGFRQPFSLNQSFLCPLPLASSKSFFCHLFFLLPLTSRSRATLKTLSSFLLCTYLYHLTPFTVTNPSTVTFNPILSIYSSVVFLQLSGFLLLSL